MLEIKSVESQSFKAYGRVITGYDTKELVDALCKNTEAPADRVIYVPSEKELEKLLICSEFQDNEYGGMPIQLGYCNGTNTKLNCLEYHKDSEINVAAEDMILLLAKREDITDGKLDTKKVEAFLVKKGMAVEVYATSLHYAPCCAKKGLSFRVAIILPKGTNTEKPVIKEHNEEDIRLFARNKWLLAHKDADAVKKGGYVGLTGENIDIINLIP